MYSTTCKCASIEIPLPCGFDVQLSNIHLEPSRQWMGATHFLTKRLEQVKTEMSLHALAYNLKRLIALLGTAAVMKAVMA